MDIRNFKALIFSLLIFFLLGNANVYASDLKTIELTCEYLENPIGIDSNNPRLSWKIKSSAQSVLQSAYEIRVGTNEKNFSDRYLVWSSGKVSSDQSVHISYLGKKLESKKRYYWQVRITDNKGNVSPWSDVAFWEMGILKADDWLATWIQSADLLGNTGGPAHMFRKEFSLSSKITKARLYITAHGVYEAMINGKRVGNDYFTPGWTSYSNRLQYQVYDVTSMVLKGENAIGVTIGDGWFRGGLSGGKENYGKDLVLLAQLEIEYASGEKKLVTTDGSWKSSINGPIRMSDLYNGETYDARKDKDEWLFSNFKDDGWISVKVNEQLSYAQLIASIAPPVTSQERFKLKEIIKSRNGETIIDFGQNLVGWIKFKVNGISGDSIIITHAEVLDKEGNFYTENLRAAKQKIKYILKGGEEEIYEPHFSFQGFRYIKLEGAIEKLDIENIEAIALYTDMATTGVFETSNSLINQLQQNIKWGQKGNFLDVPTDCPQRDERLGWTGDAQVFFNTAAYNMNVAGFFTKWLRDLKADQHANGSVPHIIPNIWKHDEGGSSGWGDAATIIPWNFYQVYGDTKILEDQYTSMKAWINFISSRTSNHLWNQGWHFGDWLFYDPMDDLNGKAAITEKHLIAQVFYANSVQNMVNAAEVLNKPEDVQVYTELLRTVKDAFVKEYMSQSGRLVSGTQTAYVLALHFDMLPENFRQQAVERLVENIRNYDNHLSTGFLGTPYLCHVLTRFGYNDLAYTLLMQDTYPSWLYPVKMGATTIWERWDGIKPDGSFQNPAMNSFNHYAYGAIGEWMYKNIAGIKQKKSFVGYKEFEIAPIPGGGLTSAKGELETLYGKIASSWSLSNNQMTMRVEVPVNTKAHVFFHNALRTSIKKAGIPINLESGEESVLVGSGIYDFSFEIKE